MRVVLRGPARAAVANDQPEENAYIWVLRDADQAHAALGGGVVRHHATSAPLTPRSQGAGAERRIDSAARPRALHATRDRFRAHRTDPATPVSARASLILQPD